MSAAIGSSPNDPFTARAKTATRPVRERLGDARDGRGRRCAVPLLGVGIAVLLRYAIGRAADSALPPSPGGERSWQRLPQHSGATRSPRGCSSGRRRGDASDHPAGPGRRYPNALQHRPASRQRRPPTGSDARSSWEGRSSRQRDSSSARPSWAARSSASQHACSSSRARGCFRRTPSGLLRSPRSNGIGRHG